MLAKIKGIFKKEKAEDDCRAIDIRDQRSTKGSIRSRDSRESNDDVRAYRKTVLSKNQQEIRRALHKS